MNQNNEEIMTLYIFSVAKKGNVNVYPYIIIFLYFVSSFRVYPIIKLYFHNFRVVIDN